MIDRLILILKSWSLAVLPVLGFLVGYAVHWALATKDNRQFEGLIIHLITVIMLVFIAASVFSNDDTLKTPNDRIFCIAVSYLFVLGAVLGLMR
jgi:hypothetical protein